ncbi:hypothetical protein MRX96_043077 [Rhipicephalus microplus]
MKLENTLKYSGRTLTLRHDRPYLAAFVAVQIQIRLSLLCAELCERNWLRVLSTAIKSSGQPRMMRRVIGDKRAQRRGSTEAREHEFMAVVYDVVLQIAIGRVSALVETNRAECGPHSRGRLDASSWTIPFGQEGRHERDPNVHEGASEHI